MIIKIILRRVLFEKVQHTGDCGLTGRFADNRTNLPLKSNFWSQVFREAFWNVYRPGCSEHYVIHVLRNDPAFVKELDFVMEKDGQLIGQNIFVKTIIEADDGREIPVLTMGPIGIIPELKHKGYGKAILDYDIRR